MSAGDTGRSITESLEGLEYASVSYLECPSAFELPLTIWRGLAIASDKTEYHQDSSEKKCTDNSPTWEEYQM